MSTRPSLPRMAQASFSTATRSHLLPALRDDGQDVRVPREDRMSEVAVPGSPLSRLPALRDVPTSL